MLRELYDEPISDEELAALVEKPPADLSTVEVRRMMIRLRQIDRSRDGLKEIRNAVVATYNERIARYDNEEKRTRDSLYAFCAQHGTVSFPDVGSAYLSSRPAKIDVAEDEKAKEWALANGYVKTEPDMTAAKKALLEAGEIPPETSGMTFEPPREILVVRGA